MRPMSLWYTEDFENVLRLGLRVKRSLVAKRSDYQLIEVFESYAMGKTLALDGILQTSEGDEAYYHEMMVHPALTCTPSIERVLVIGGGDGGTVREVLKHPEVEHCTMVEIDEQVVAACKEHMPNHGAWDDPRLELLFADGIKFVADAEPESYDVVLLDGSDPVGPAKGLFNREFYADVKRCLKTDGVFALQSESPQLMLEIFIEIVESLRQLFTTVAPYFGPVLIYGDGGWSWTFATDRVDQTAPIAERVKRIEAGSHYYNGNIHQAAFALPNHLVRRWAEP